MFNSTRWTARLVTVIALLAAPAQASVVERIVAVVGEQAILLSDLRQRARPFLVRVHQQLPEGAQRAAAISQVYSQLLDKMVEEELEQRAANRANITVTAREIDDALSRIAAQNRVTVRVVLDEAIRSGLTERQYRQEIRRQLLEAKLLNLRVQGRLQVTEDDLVTAYQQLVADERTELPFRVAWIRIDTPPGASADAAREQRTLAERVAAQARAGADFADLARRYSDDTTTRGSGGLLGRVKPGQLPPALDTAAQGLEIGEVSSPVRVGNAFAVLQLVEREESTLPLFEDAKAELAQRVYMQKMGKARGAWLQGLRKRIHVDIRL